MRLERQQYTVEEGGQVQLCLIVDSLQDCPINFPFEYFLSTVDSNPTTGKQLK